MNSNAQSSVTDPFGQAMYQDAAASEAPAPPVADLLQGLLGAVVEQTDEQTDGASARRVREQANALEAFLDENRVGPAIDRWLGASRPDTQEELARRLNRDVAAIDRFLNDQLNAILHAKPFQKLEASWRSLYGLVEKASDEEDASIVVRVLNVSWREIERDFERAIEFDQSQIWRKIYENEFGTPGGTPFGAVIGDYEARHKVSPEHPHDDVRVLESLSKVAAAAFCPFVLSASPAMFGLDDFHRLEQELNHESVFSQTEYLKWQRLRRNEESRFLCLTLPRVLVREPYRSTVSRPDRFVFQEDVTGTDRSKYLWGNAAYAFGGVLIRSFAQAGWLADLRGARRGVDSGGLVTGLPTHSFGVDALGVAHKTSTEVVITDHLERELSEQGFMSLCDCKDTAYSAFLSNPSIQKPVTYDNPVATVNARISSMLQYMLCVSRFAHYLKVIARDKLGGFSETDEFERQVQDWIVRYVTVNSEANATTKARFPLRDADVRVEPTPGKPGTYQCQMLLRPHYELDDMQASIRVVTELAPARVGR